MSASQSGISLVELMVIVSIIALTLTLGIPSFSGSRAKMQRTQALQDLTDSFALARSEATRRGVAVRVCASDDGATCTAANPPPWDHGWIAFTDVNQDGSLSAGADELIHARQFSAPAFTLTPDITLANGVLFGGDGLPSAAGQFTYCDNNESQVYALSLVGRFERLSSGAGCP